MPPNATQNDAWRFINENKVKILAKQSKQKTVKKEFLTENSTLKTLTFNIVMQRAERENIFFSLKDDLLIIEFPVEIDCSTDDVQQQLWKGITYFLRKEAKRILPVQVRLLADRFGFYFSNVKIQQSKTRWGSCSSRKSINLSLYLLLLPQELIDYVILHELCHTKEMNHSPRFWQWMDKVTDNKSAALRRELKNFKTPKIY
ncbi:MAG: M48 family metallopeptidase [Paludibacter sp.]|nr:M48 family metallopeptidase [Paludibacter sp.]